MTENTGNFNESVMTQFGMSRHILDRKLPHFTLETMAVSAYMRDRLKSFATELEKHLGNTARVTRATSFPRDAEMRDGTLHRRSQDDDKRYSLFVEHRMPKTGFAKEVGFHIVFPSRDRLDKCAFSPGEGHVALLKGTVSPRPSGEEEKEERLGLFDLGKTLGISYPERAINVLATATRFGKIQACDLEQRVWALLKDGVKVRDPKAADELFARIEKELATEFPALKGKLENARTEDPSGPGTPGVK